MRTTAHLILTPLLLFLAVTFLGGFLVGLSGQPQTGPATAVVGLLALLSLPVGVTYGWKNRHR